MADHRLTSEQQALRDLVQDFAKHEIRPAAAHHDLTGEFPLEVLKKAWQLGLMNSHIPAAFGGAGLGVFENCLIAEENGWGCTGISTAMEANTLAEAPVIVAGSDAQKKKFLTPLTEELLFVSYCVTEPAAGSDVQGIKSRAVPKGNDYVINGNKMFITNAGVAHWYFVLAYTDPTKGHKGMSGFLVPRQTAGIEVGKKEQNLGQRASDTRAVAFKEVVVPKENRLGQEGEGWRIAMAAFDHTRPIVASGAVGLARAAMEHAIAYAQTRQTFGKAIAEHQAVSFMLADMAKDIEAARLLVRQSAELIDQGLRNTLEASMAKAFAADMAMRVATDAVQVFGGYGYSREYPVEKLMRDAKIFQIYEGTSQIQRQIIARELFKRYAPPS